MKHKSAIAVFNTPIIQAEAVVTPHKRGSTMRVKIRKLPAGEHGFHIHKAGDLRGKGCAGACAHFHAGRKSVAHGGPPGTRRARHSGDLGNIRHTRKNYRYYLADIKPSMLWGRSLIIHADKDDLGTGPHDDSKTTGHSGARIGCAIFGRGTEC